MTRKLKAPIASLGKRRRVPLGDTFLWQRGAGDLADIGLIGDLRKNASPVKKQTTFDGFQLKLEWLPGDLRKGVNKKGEKWEKRMHAAYGYIPGTKGVDGEAVDAYLARRPYEGSPIYVVHQLKDDGSHDEDKVLLGFPTEAAAKGCYLQHTPAKYFGSIKEYDRAGFEKYLESNERPLKKRAEEIAMNEFDKQANIVAKLLRGARGLVRPGAATAAERGAMEQAMKGHRVVKKLPKGSRPTSDPIAKLGADASAEDLEKAAFSQRAKLLLAGGGLGLAGYGLLKNRKKKPPAEPVQSNYDWEDGGGGVQRGATTGTVHQRRLNEAMAEHGHGRGLGKEAMEHARVAGPEATYRMAFLDEVLQLGGIGKVASHPHPEPFIADSQPKGVTHDEQTEHGPGEGLGKGKKKSPAAGRAAAHDG